MSLLLVGISSCVLRPVQEEAGERPWARGCRESSLPCSDVGQTACSLWHPLQREERPQGRALCWEWLHCQPGALERSAAQAGRRLSPLWQCVSVSSFNPLDAGQQVFTQ